MRYLRLTEWKQESDVELTTAERDQIKGVLPNARIELQQGKENIFEVNPQGYVGVVQTADLVIEIKPKLPIDRVLFLITYVLDPKYWKKHQLVQSGNISNLQEAIALPFINFTHKLLKEGLCSGYKEVEDSLHRIKGKIRFEDQLKRRQRITVPVEVTYDDFTADVEENRRILAASHKLLRLKRLSEETKSSLRGIIRKFESVDVTHRQYDRRNIKPIRYSRLNQHYEHTLSLAKLILSDETIELYGQSVHSSGLLFDMSEVFEKFIRVALRESLGLSEREFPEKTGNLYLDDNKKLRVAPDLSWWSQGQCVFIGDVKYKETKNDGERPDIYQLLSFVTAGGVDNGFLIYAAGETENVSYQIGKADKELMVETLELSNDPSSILAEIDSLAEKIKIACELQPLSEAQLLNV